MLGGPSKADKPMSIFLRSGDICVMSGHCRLAYHGVPKILSPPHGNSDLACFNFKATNPSTSMCTSKRQSRDENTSDSICKDNLIQEKHNCDDSTSSLRECDSKKKSITPVEYLNNIVTNNDSLLVSKASKDEYSCNFSDQQISSSDACTQQKKSPSLDEHLIVIDALNQDIEERLASMDWKPFSVYMQQSRINLNVRQVFPQNRSCSENCPVAAKHLKLEDYYQMKKSKS